MPRTVTSRAVRSYRTLSPLPDPLAWAIGGLLSVALVVGFPGRYRHPALWSPDFPPLRPSPRKDDDEAATVWSASARSIEGSRDFVTLRCAFLSPERQQHFWMPDKYCQKRPESLLQRHDAREYAKDSVDAIVMHYPYIVRQAAGNANHWLMIFFATFATPIGTLPRILWLSIRPSPVTTSVQSWICSSGSVPP